MAQNINKVQYVHMVNSMAGQASLVGEINQFLQNTLSVAISMSRSNPNRRSTMLHNANLDIRGDENKGMYSAWQELVNYLIMKKLCAES